jgi:two-component system, LytTR family, response regulator
MMPDSNRIRVVVVDDEPPARRKLIRFLRQEEDIELVGEAEDGPTAARLIDDVDPDLVFLDVQMPGMTGFEVLEKLRGPLPMIVFVTAYDQYAVKAFEVNAADYLLKPFDQSRIETCLSRVRANLNRHANEDIHARMEKLLAEVTGRTHLNRIMVKTHGRVVFLQTREIDWIEAVGNYVDLHVGSQTYTLRETLNALESKLDPKSFVRVHRSTIVNLDRIKELQPWSHNDYLVILKNGKEIRMSRRYRANLKSL